jgi:hypothetical protein
VNIYTYIENMMSDIFLTYHRFWACCGGARNVALETKFARQGISFDAINERYSSEVEGAAVCAYAFGGVLGRKDAEESSVVYSLS